jgi:hypothetical protein
MEVAGDSGRECIDGKGGELGKGKMMQEQEGLAVSDGLASRHGCGLHNLTIDLGAGRDLKAVTVANSCSCQAARIVADKDDRRLSR